MQIEEIHYEIERQWNVQSNQYRRKLSDLEKDSLINSMIFEYVEIFLHGTNPKQYDLGFEINSQRMDMLQTLVRKEQILPDSVSNGIYTFKFADTSEPYRSYRSSQAQTNCGDFRVTIEQHEDSITILDHHRKPSRKFKQAIGFIRNDSVLIHTNQEFEVDSLLLTYVKEPLKVALGTYESLDIAGQPPAIIPRQNTDLPEPYHNLLVSLCIQELHRIYSSPNDRVTQKEKLIDLT